jgi:hypothetical protein
MTVAVLEYAGHRAVGQPFPLAEHREPAGARIEPVQPRLGTSPDCSGAIDGDRIDPIAAETSAGRIVAMAGELTRGRVETLEPGIPRRQPQYSVGVFGNAVVLADRRGGDSIHVEFVRRGVEPADSRVAPRPQRAVAADEQSGHDVIGETAGIRWIVPIDLEAAGLRIEAIEAAAKGAKPHVPRLVLRHRNDDRARDRETRVARLVERVAVRPAFGPAHDAVEHALGADPQNSSAVFQH